MRRLNRHSICFERAAWPGTGCGKLGTIARVLLKGLKPSLGLTLVTMLCLTGSYLVGQSVVPPSAQAYTAQVNVLFDVQPGETYDTLLRRAEAVARTAAQRRFDRDILITEVAIVITAQNQTAIAPILSLNATRSQWQSRPDPKIWSTYYRTAQVLLHLNAKSPSMAPAVPMVTSAPLRPSAAPRSNPRPAPTPIVPGGDGTLETPDTLTQPSPQPSPIIPERIPTPGRIGK